MKRLLSYFLLLTFGLLVHVPSIHAADNHSELAGGYTIEGIPNKNQIDKNVSYFYLDEKPGATDTIKVKLINDSSERKILNIKVTNANTNINGLIDYTGTLKDSKALKVPLNSIISPKTQEVKVNPKSDAEATFNIKMPKKKQKGIILGGIVVSEKQNKTQNKQNMSIGSTYSYTLGVLLTNKPSEPIKQNISVQLESVKAILSDGKKVVQANILNPNPYLFGEATVSGKIMNKDETKVIQETKKEHVKIAPQSVYPFQFDWKKENLKPGIYVFIGKVKTNNDEWTFRREFTITDETAQKINKESVFKVQIPNWLKIIVILLIILSVTDLIYIIVTRKKNS